MNRMQSSATPILAAIEGMSFYRVSGRIAKGVLLCLGIASFSSVIPVKLLGQTNGGKQSDVSPQIQEYFQTAKQAEKAGDYEGAVNAYLAILKIRPDFAEMRQNLGLVYYVQNKNQEAISSFQTALKRKPDLLGANLFLGMAWARTNQYEKAILPLKTALSLNPNERNAYLNLGLSYVETGQLDDAAQVLQQGLQRFPKDVDMLYNLGKVYTKMMTTTFQRMAEAEPDSYRVHQLLGESYEARRETTRAIEEYKTAIARKPGTPGLQYALANIYWKEGDLEQAEKGFKKELEISPEQYLATWKLGNIYLIRRQTDQAIVYLKRALEQKPDLGQAHRDLARALAEKGDLEGAMGHYKKVTELAPDEPTVHYRLALIYKQMGKQQEERAELERFQQLKAARDQREKAAKTLPSGDEELERSTADTDSEIQ
jgi:tetratricopeptide (TPR) repeat protein